MRKKLSHDFYSFEKRTRISEAIIKRVPDNEVDNPKYNYDITFPETQQCSKNFRMAVGGVICSTCYGKALGDKMRSLTDEQQRPFLEHQIKLHRNPEKWLREVTQFVADYESAFEKQDFGLVPAWKNLLDEYLNGKSSIQQITQYQLPENFKLKSLNIKTDKLDIYQTAILFHLLRETEIFINYSNADLAKFAHYLTGHSEQNLRTDKGFSNIYDIMLQKRNGKKAYNLHVLKKALLSVVEKIDILSERK